MKSPIIIFILLIVPLFIFSQEENRMDQHLSIGVGYHSGLFKDITYSPLLYTTKSLSFDLSYQKDTQNGNQWYVNLDFTPGSIQTEAEQFFTADRYFGNLEIGYLFDIHKVSSKSSFLIGGQYHTHADLIFYNDLAAISFFLTHGFDITGKWNYQFNEKSHFQTQIVLPLVAVLVRPAYTGWDIDIIDNPDNYFKIATDGKLTSWNDFFSVTWKNRFTQQVSNKIGLMVQYHLSFHQSDQVETVKNLNHQFFFGATLNF